MYKRQIPRGAEFDEPRFHGDLPVTYKNFEDVIFWRDLWKFCIIVSTLSHLELSDETRRCNEILEEAAEKFENANIIEYVKIAMLQEEQVNPSTILCNILSKNISIVERLRLKTHLVSELSTKSIRSSVNIFVDAFDQTLTAVFCQGQDSPNLEVWRLSLIHI